MANIELVIKIPEEEYQGVVNADKGRGQWGNDLLGILCAGISDGTPLPKGHGRLIDADALINTFHDDVFIKNNTFGNGEYCNVYANTVLAVIKKAPTIIEAEADKESEEE